jgi:PAS domain S-box-containing protein
MPPCERLISWSAAKRESGRKTLKTPIEVDPVANAVSVALGLRHEEQAFEVPARLFEELPFAIYVCDRAGLLLRYNRRAAELWGRSPKIRDPNERFCGSYRMFRPDGSLLPHHECPMADVLRTGVSVREQEVHIERPDGLRGIALLDIEVIKDSDGNIVGAVNCFQDITERKRGEEAALRLAAIIESSDDAIVSKDLDGTIRSWNGGAQRIFGYLAEEVIGKPIAILIPPDRHNEETAILERLRRGERIGSYETVRRHKDGSPVNVSLTVSPLKNTEGRVIGASKIVRDITQEKHAEVRLRESEARLQAAVDLVKLGRYAWNPQTNELQWDDTLRAMWGLPAGAPVDYDVWRSSVHPDDLARVEAAIQRCTDPRGDGVYDIEYRFIGKMGGVERWIATRGQTNFEKDVPVSFFGVALEVTERKRIEGRLERRVEERTRELEEANRQLRSQIEKREFAEAEVQQLQRLDAIGKITSGVAHDFNNLLSVVLTNARLLSRTVQRPDDQEGIELIRAAADRGAKLIAQLLAFSRKQPLEPYEVDLNSKIAGMGDLLGATLGGTVQLKTIFAPDLWPALVDPNQIEMIVLNLAINARDAMQAGGTLTIETFNTILEGESFRPEEPSPGDYVVLAVKDTGTGIPDDVLPHVFEPFFTTKEPGKGSGLGLAQVFGFAKQSDGGVLIETRLGQGTTVKVFLPRAGVDIADHHADSVDASKRLQNTKGLRVLVVDDDKAVLRSTVKMLDVLGYATVSAESGSEALRVLASNQEIDLVLADFAMPEMSGGELAKAIRAMRPILPVILITGYRDLNVRKEFNDLRIILKPFTEDDLVNAIGAALGRASEVR